jgi:hypothetical protein
VRLETIDNLRNDEDHVKRDANGESTSMVIGTMGMPVYIVVIVPHLIPLLNFSL